MRGKLPRYFLLSFLSFCFFTVVFRTIADAQVISNATSVRQDETARPVAVPTPTIYFAPTTTPEPKQIILTQAIYNATDIPSPSPINSPTPTATPIPTTSPTPQATTPAGPVNLDSLFSQYSTQYSVSETELKKIAQCESGFNTNSDTGTYAGMFQFSATTWESERTAMGLDPNPDLRKDPGEAIRTTAFMLSRGGENAWPNCH